MKQASSSTAELSRATLRYTTCVASSKLLPASRSPESPRSHSIELLRSRRALTMSSLGLPRFTRISYLQATAALRASSCRSLHVASIPQSAQGRRQEPTTTARCSTHSRSFHSTTRNNHGQETQKQPPKIPPPTPSLGTIFSAAFRSTLHSIRNVSRPETLRDAFRKSPEEMVLALILYVTLLLLQPHLGYPAWHRRQELTCLTLVLLQLLEPASTPFTFTSTISTTGSSPGIQSQLLRPCAAHFTTVTIIRILSAH